MLQIKGEIKLEIQQEVDWTILIYANGNNDLEPEMRRAMLDAERVGSSSTVHVVMQIGRAEYKLLKLMRQDITSEGIDRWSGVRRYFVRKGDSELIVDLKTVNMADPKELYEFIRWGMCSYPAKKYMLILGGHTYHCVGMMTDYCTNAPYIMGIPEMAYVINVAANDIGEKIDILVMDTCCSNSLELIYEFGKEEEHAIQSVITYIEDGPIEGLPYDHILNVVQANSKAEDIRVVIKHIIEELSYDLISFEVEYQRLRKIKQMFHEKTFQYRLKDIDEGQAYHKLSSYEREKILASISDELTPLIIYFKRSQHNNASLVTVTESVSDHLKLLKHYHRLAFAQENDWANFINEQPLDSIGICSVKTGSLLPLEMSPEEVCAYISIMNPTRDQSEQKNMLEAVYQYKKWVM